MQMKQAIIIFALVLTSFGLNAHTDSYTPQQTTGSIVMIDAVMLVSSGDASETIAEIQFFTTGKQLQFTLTGCLTSSCAYAVAYLPRNTYQVVVTLDNGKTFTQKVVLD